MNVSPVGVVLRTRSARKRRSASASTSHAATYQCPIPEKTSSGSISRWLHSPVDAAKYSI